MRKLAASFLIALSVTALACIPVYKTTRLRVRADTIRFTDASTGGAISEVLVIPHYWSSEPPTKGGREIYYDYVARHFIYRKGNGFNLPNEKEAGLNWFPGCKFTGEETSLKGLLIVVPGYQPSWFGVSATEGLGGDLELTPTSAEKSSQLIEDLLDHIENRAIRMPTICGQRYPMISPPCVLGVHFNKNERGVVRSYLQRAMK
jgi:hypothetical protein